MSDLKLKTDYPNSIVGDNKIRRIKQISVSLPALAALAHPGHIVCYAPGDSLPYRRDAS
nr:hypothetical protein [Photorhabdus sp. CRI-LC]